MQKSSFLFFLIIAATVGLASYQAMYPLSAGIAFVRFLGLEAFLLLCVSLSIGPIAIINPSYAQLIEPRRAVGLAAFVLTVGHVLLAVSIEFNWQLAIALTQMSIIVSIVAGAIMTLLAITSSDYAVKLLGAKNWKRVQSLNYPLFILSFAHFVLQSTGLFATANGAMSINLAELFAVLAGTAVVALQIWGATTRMSRVKKPAENEQSHREKPEAVI